MDSQRRRPDWNSVPSGPMGIIVKEVKKNLGRKGLHALRLVSKSWRDICTEYCGAISAELKTAADLTHLCNAFSSMTSLCATKVADSTDLSPLSNCSQLTSLSLWGGNSDPLVDLAVLPKNLRVLKLVHLWGRPGCLEHIKFTGLTQIILELPKPVKSDPHILLEHLPDLQELRIAYTDTSYEEDVVDDEDGLTINCFRYPKMTCLSFMNMNLLYQHEAPPQVAPLRELHLHILRTNTAVLNHAFTFLPNLTLLDLNMCTHQGDHNRSPLSTLRELVISLSDPSFITLAGPTLQSLRWEVRPTSMTRANAAEFEVIPKLSGLAKLELHGWYLNSNFTAFWAIHGSHVKDLVLYECTGVADFLLKGRAFASLERLCLTDVSEFLGVGERPTCTFELEVAENKRLHDILRSLPNLVQLSGMGKTFAQASKGGIQGWQKSFVPAEYILQAHHDFTWLIYDPNEMTREVWSKLS